MVNCGGGSGGEDTVPSTPSITPEAEEPAEPDVVEEPEEPVELEKPEEVADDCYRTDQETLEFFLQDILEDDLIGESQCGNGSVRQWQNNAVLKVARETTDEEKRLVRTAVEGINRVLPNQYDIDFRENEYVEPLAAKVRSGEITIDFALPEDLWCDNDCPIGRTRTRGTSEIESAQIRIRTHETAGVQNQCEDAYQAIVTHEILHALGFCHANHSDHQYHGGDFVKTIMTAYTRPPCKASPHHALADNPHNPAAWNSVDILTDLDKDALRAIYSLENGDYPEELRIEPDQECVE